MPLLFKKKRYTDVFFCISLKWFNIYHPNKPSLPTTILNVAQSYEYSSLKLIVNQAERKGKIPDTSLQKENLGPTFSEHERDLYFPRGPKKTELQPALLEALS